MPSPPSVVGSHRAPSPPRKAVAWHSSITAARPTRPARPALARPARRVAERHPRRAAPRHLPPRRAVRRPVGPGASRSRRSRPSMARREYELLRNLHRLDVPCVEPFARDHRPDRTPTASRSTPCLVTRHLQFSLPYRALFTQIAAPGHRDPARRRPGRAARAAAPRRLLLGRRLAVEHAVPARRRRVRRLPRRRRDRRAARDGSPTVSASTTSTSPGSNIAGELMDLEAGGLLEDGRRPDRDRRAASCRATATLWDELTGAEAFDRQRALADRRPGPSGSTTSASTSTSWRSPPTSTARTIQIQPKVVDAGHHSRRLLRLTGLDVEENQARRLLNDLDAFRAAHRPPGRGRGDRRPRVADRASSSR